MQTRDNVGGVMKHFFDREALEALFGAGWNVAFMAEKTITRYGSKVIWEVVVKKVE